MPEGPECARIADSLNHYLGGKYFIGGIYYPHVTSTGKMSKNFGYDLIPTLQGLQYGSKVIRIYAKAKRIIFELEYQGYTYYLVSFLAMTGHWLRYPPSSVTVEMSFSSTYRKASSATTSTTSTSLEVVEVVEILGNVEEKIYYEDTRLFGFLQVHYTPQSLATVFTKIGPDLLHDNITIADYYCVIKSVPHLALEEFVMEQKYFSGIGNYLRSEILYLSRLNPLRTLQTLSDHDIALLYTNSLKIIKYSYECNGLTIGDYIDPDGNKGIYKPMVYHQAQDPEGRPVQSFKLKPASQTIFWVPGYQL
jgi:formamidopyrimidine-DNA glycosylase